MQRLLILKLLGIGSCLAVVGVDYATTHSKRPGFVRTGLNCFETLIYGDLETFIDQTAQKYGVDPNLVKAIIFAESTCNPYAVSRIGAKGLMQLNPRFFRLRNHFDPRANIRRGVRELARLQGVYGDQIELIIAAYNAGQGTVRKHGGVPPISETQSYVRDVLKYYRMLS